MFTSGDKMKREIDRQIGAASAVRERCSEEETELEGEALNLPVNLRSNDHLRPQALGSDLKNTIADTSS